MTATTTVAKRVVIPAVLAAAALAMAGCARAHETGNPFVGPKGSLDTPFGWHPAQPAAPGHS